MMMDTQRYQQLAAALDGIERAHKADNAAWLDTHEVLRDKAMATAPSGSGIDCGTQLLDESKPNKLVFRADFHHMDDAGGYDGWTEHTVIVTPSLMWGIDIRITGRNRNDIKEYLNDVYGQWLEEVVVA